MKLIVDAGSTKTEWILLEGIQVRERFITEGFNPNYAEIQLFAHLVSDLQLPVGIRSVYYYGTGCGQEKNCHSIAEVLRQCFPTAEIHVTHDLMAACHALLGHEKGIVCILGTGSNSCYYDGEIIVEKAVSLGYLIGDEGSGMHIGREVVRSYFYGFMPEVLRRQFDAAYHLDLDTLLQNLYHRGQPSRYLASFAKFAGENQTHPYIYDMVKGCFKAFVEAFVCRYSECKEVTISFIGSVAYHFQEILEEVLVEYGLSMGEVMQTPTEGLIRYYRMQA